MKTPITYYGGKQTLLKHILPLIPNHSLYTEAFAGGCAVLFAKDPVPCEIINDTNKTLINFYIVAKNNYEELKNQIDTTLHSRDTHLHAAYIYKNPEWFTKVQWAWSVWVLSRMSFAAKLNGPFGYDRNGTTSKKIDNAKLNFSSELCDRLARVTIENRDGIKVITTYDAADAFHFIDPPYIETNCGHYSDMFSEQNFVDLLNVLVTIKGKFMLTMFPNNILLEYSKCNNWTIHKVERNITACKTSRRKQEEWLVCNY